MVYFFGLHLKREELVAEEPSDILNRNDGSDWTPPSKDWSLLISRDELIPVGLPLTRLPRLPVDQPPPDSMDTVAWTGPPYSQPGQGGASGMIHPATFPMHSMFNNRPIRAMVPSEYRQTFPREERGQQFPVMYSGGAIPNRWSYPTLDNSEFNPQKYSGQRLQEPREAYSAAADNHGWATLGRDGRQEQPFVRLPNPNFPDHQQSTRLLSERDEQMRKLQYPDSAHEEEGQASPADEPKEAEGGNTTPTGRNVQLIPATSQKIILPNLVMNPAAKAALKKLSQYPTPPLRPYVPGGTAYRPRVSKVKHKQYRPYRGDTKLDPGSYYVVGVRASGRGAGDDYHRSSSRCGNVPFTSVSENMGE